MVERVQEIRVNDTGTTLEVEITEWDKVTNTYIPVDISAATLKDIVIKRPDGSTVIVSALFTTTGVDGLIYIITATGHLPISGTYYIQGNIALATWVGSSSIGDFIVHENLV